MSTDANQAGVFLAVSVYENAEMELLARGLCEAIRRRIGRNLLLRLAEWKLEMLAKSALRQSAALDADAAQLLVVALSDRSVLPREVKRWAASWTSPHPVKPSVLVVLLRSDLEPSESPAFNYSCLEDRAKQAGMQIILHHITPDSVASPPPMGWLSPDECRWIPEVADSLASTCAALGRLPF